MTLEKLLNSLIKRWWKPFNVNCAWTNVEVMNRLREDNYYIPEHTKIIFKTDEHWHVFDCNIRDLVSKSSWLRQFCCNKRLTNRDEKSDWSKNAERDEDWVIDRDCLIFSSDYEYWLIECSLLDERDLEKFLLQNIKVEWK